MYLLREAPERSKKPRVQLLGSGTILREVIAAADLLAEDWGVTADVWSVTSFTELRRDGIQAERWNMLHPTAEPQRPYVLECLDGRRGPVIASTDYIRAFADQIRQWVPGAVPGARHRRLRPQRLPTGAQALLRGRSPLRDRRRTEVARRLGRHRPPPRPGRDRALRDRPRGPDAHDDMTTTGAIASGPIGAPTSSS